MKLISLTLFLCLHVYCFAQQKVSDNDVYKTVNVIKATILSPGIAIERKAFSDNQTAYLDVSAAASFGYSFSSSLGTNAFLNFDPSSTLQYRFYYNGKKRSEKGKRTARNSMNYVALSLGCLLTRDIVADDHIKPQHRRPYVEQSILWGMQRNYPKRFSLDLMVGPGYYFVKSHEANGNEMMSHGFTIVSNVTLGWWLNK